MTDPKGSTRDPDPQRAARRDPATGLGKVKVTPKPAAAPAPKAAAPAPKPPRPAERRPAGPVRPVARLAHMRRRHYGLIASFVALVLVPLAAIAVYMYSYAADQYASTAGFTVRAEDGVGATDLLGGLAQFSPGSGADADIVFEFIASQEMVQRLTQRIDLIAHYSGPHVADPIFALPPDATMEQLVAHWQSVLRVSFNQSNGLIELRVLAYDPVTAQTLGQAIIAESQNLVNGLNLQARSDTIRFAQQDLDAALQRLRAAREALTLFRTSTQIVDPESDLQGRMGVLNNLQQQLAEALIEFDLLSGTTTNPDDPRLAQASRRIDVIRERIDRERLTFTQDDIGANGEDYPTLMAEFEGLVVDREFAEESYRVALTALDIARTSAARQSRYLAVFITPTLPESAAFPRRELIVGLAALFLTLAWVVLALVYYSIRDRQ